MSSGYTTLAVGTKAANTTLKVSDSYVRADATSANVTLTLPPVSSMPAGRDIVIKRADASANTLTVAPNGTDKIDTANTSKTISANGVLRLKAVSASVGWDTW